MKKLVTISALILLGTAAMAQPVIADGNNYPAVGYTNYVSIGSGTVNTATGANHTWDFSALPASTVGAVAVIDPATSPFAATFPTANHCLRITPNGSTTPNYDYDRVSSTVIEKLATNYTGTSGNNYTNPETSMPFPFHYGDAITDAFQKSGGSTNNVTLTYDGYGTIITPYGTYNNVFRVKEDYGGTDIDYSWYTTNPLFPIFVYSASSNSYTIIGGNPSGLSGVNADKATVNIFPNPFTTQATINISGNIDTRDAKLHVFDILGKEVRSLDAASKNMVLEREQLPAGMYFYKLLGNTATVIATGKMVIN